MSRAFSGLGSGGGSGLGGFRDDFRRMLASMRAGGKGEAEVRRLLEAGYTADEIRVGVRALAAGGRVGPPAARAGPVSCRKGSTGFDLCVWTPKTLGFDEEARTEGFRYYVTCEKHGTLVGVRTLADARSTDVIDFCDCCRGNCGVYSTTACPSCGRGGLSGAGFGLGALRIPRDGVLHRDGHEYRVWSYWIDRKDRGYGTSGIRWYWDKDGKGPQDEYFTRRDAVAALEDYLAHPEMYGLAGLGIAPKGRRCVRRLGSGGPYTKGGWFWRGSESARELWGTRAKDGVSEVVKIVIPRRPGGCPPGYSEE